jgi:amino acid transporter
VAFVAPSILIGVISTAFTNPGTASGFLSTFGILGVVIMYLAGNVALIVAWARLRRRGERKSFLPWLALGLVAAGFVYQFVLGAVRPAVLHMAPALLEGDEDQASDAGSVTTPG